MCIILLLFLSLFGNGATGLWTFSAVLSLSESCELELDVEVEVELDRVGVAGCETWLSTFFPHLSVWTTLHWLIWESWASKIWIEFFGLASGWLVKVPLGLSLRELASWLIWTSIWEIDLGGCSTFVQYFAWRCCGSSKKSPYSSQVHWVFVWCVGFEKRRRMLD